MHGLYDSRKKWVLTQQNGPNVRILRDIGTTRANALTAARGSFYQIWKGARVGMGMLWGGLAFGPRIE